MSKRGDKEFVKDIKEAISRIENYTMQMDFSQFLKDIKTQDAVVRNIEIIGEAVKNLSKDLRKKHKEVQWKDVAGMRDKIIHFYFGIKWEIVWSVIKNNLPELKEKIETILKEIEEK